MSDVLVTVVLPVYNVENYIHRAVESIVRQTYQNLEIILVDDGSPDDCPRICDEWAKKDSRIRVIHKENAGLSMARNSGIQAASGQYIFFLDSDDYVEHTLVETCVQTALETKAQIVVYGYDRIGEDGKVSAHSVPELPQLVMQGDAVREFVIPCLAGPMIRDGKKYHILSSAWGAMYAMDTIRAHAFRFVSEREIISEDIYSNLIYYQYVDCIAIIPQALYHYCEHNAQSLTRTYHPNRFERNKHFYRQALKLCDELGYPVQAKKNLSNQMLSNIIVSVKQIISADMPICQKRSMVRGILRDDISNKVLADYDMRLDNNVLRKILIKCMKRRLTVAVFFLMWLKFFYER